MLTKRKNPFSSTGKNVLTVLGVLLFVIGVVLAWRGWGTTVKVGNYADTLGVDRGTLSEMRNSGGVFSAQPETWRRLGLR